MAASVRPQKFSSTKRTLAWFLGTPLTSYPHRLHVNLWSCGQLLTLASTVTSVCCMVVRLQCPLVAHPSQAEDRFPSPSLTGVQPQHMRLHCACQKYVCHCTALDSRFTQVLQQGDSLRTWPA